MTTTRTCSVDGCDLPHEGLGYCRSHYAFFKRTGMVPTHVVQRRGGDPAPRFWAKVDKTRSCWIWTGSTDGQGRYGSFYFQGKVRRAHRVALVLVGRIPNINLPAGRDVDHLCRNTLCVKPDHLEVVSHKTNVLRGVSLQAANALKTHCPRGHAYDITLKRGGRWCSVCQREASRVNQAALRARRRTAGD